ncbi:MAG: lysophospholipid acyltransferase family protein [Myxococcales bacterium]
MAVLTRFATFILGLVPRGFRLALGRALGSFAWTIGIRRKVALGNLALAFPELAEGERKRIARGAYRNLGAGILDFVGSSPRELERLLVFDGFDLFERLFAGGKGVVVASAHLGSWELLAAAAAQRGVPLSLVTRTLKGGANQELVASRARSGLREIPARGALREGVKRLRRGEVVVNLLDQNMLPKRGIFVDFFGVPACTTPAASLMAKRTGAPTLLALALNEPDGRVRLHIEGPFEVPRTGRPADDVRAHTQSLVAAIERQIRARPEQWLWLHRRWKTRPQGGVSR